MALNLCIEAIVRLFFVIIKFGFDHWGWTIIFIIFTYFFIKILGALGIRALKLGVIQYIIFFPILFLLMFGALILGFYIASWWSGIDTCSLVDSFSLWFV